MSLVLLAALLSGPAGAPADLPAYLGSTLEQFRARPAPVEAARPACSDAPAYEWLAPDPLSVRAGVVGCAFVRDGGVAGLAIGRGLEGPARFWFFEGRLYRIEMVLDARRRSALLRLLGRDWGPPERRAGAGLVWRRGPHAAAIAPAATAGQLSLVVTDPAVAEVVEARRVKLTQPPRIMTR